MSTKNEKCSFIEQNFTTSENQYYNLNLNQSKKCAALIPVQFNSKPNNDKYNATAFIVSDNYEEKGKSQSWNKSLRTSTFTIINEDKNNSKKRWRNENSLKCTNKSTLSLHITAYKNPSASDLFGTENIAGLKKEKFGSIKKRCFNDNLKSRNPFEFPRQQNGDEKNKPEVMQLTPSQQLQPPTGKFNYGEVVNGFQIKKKLGEGGFGAVYEVVNVKTGLSYAMKTELVSEGFKLLKMEVYVMRQASTIKAKHIVQIEDTGSFSDFLYVVMTMVGKSLQDIRKMCPGQKFSLGTALSVGIQSLEAIEELHQIGFLHRDIKPSNFAIGRPEINELRKIYLLDFGMCRRYLDDNKQIRRPRSRAGFRGTIRYAPLSVHIRRETCRKDDIESWLYQQIEITRGALPWRSLEEKNEVAMFKERCRYGHCLYEMMGGCPRQYIEILKYVDSLRYYDVPNYNKIYKLLRTAIKLFKVPEFPYDWEALMAEKVAPPPPAAAVPVDAENKV